MKKYNYVTSLIPLLFISTATIAASCEDIIVEISNKTDKDLNIVYGRHILAQTAPQADTAPTPASATETTPGISALATFLPVSVDNALHPNGPALTFTVSPEPQDYFYNNTEIGVQQPGTVLNGNYDNYFMLFGLSKRIASNYYRNKAQYIQDNLDYQIENNPYKIIVTHKDQGYCNPEAPTEIKPGKITLEIVPANS